MSADRPRATRDAVLDDAMKRIRALERALRAAPYTTVGVQVAQDAISVPDDTVTTLDFDSAEFDTDGFWSAGTPARLTIPLEGWYMVTAFMQLNLGANNKLAEIDYAVNGGIATTPAAWGKGSFDGPDFFGGLTVRHFNASDYLDWSVYQDSGFFNAAAGVRVALFRQPGL